MFFRFFKKLIVVKQYVKLVKIICLLIFQSVNVSNVGVLTCSYSNCRRINRISLFEIFKIRQINNFFDPLFIIINQQCRS